MNPADARRLFALANAFKEGDLTVGGTRDDRVARRGTARAAGAARVREIRRTTFVDDGISARRSSAGAIGSVTEISTR